MKIEYKIRPVTRFIVTKYSEGTDGCAGCGQSEGKGEFANPVVAYQVALALANEDQSKYKFDLGDKSLIYPTPIIYQAERTWDAQSPLGIGGSGLPED